jgi:hypothetical protein
MCVPWKGAVVVNADEMFLKTLDELEQRLRVGAPEYDVLMSAASLRKLLLDGEPLVHRVNRERRLRIRFRANCGGPPAHVIEDHPTYWSIHDGFDPETGHSRSRAPSELRLEEMLRCVVMLVDGENMSVHDLIDFCAHIEGAVHVGKPKTPKEKAQALVAEEIRVGGMPPSTQSLLAIGRVVVHGLTALRDEIRKEQGPANADG